MSEFVSIPIEKLALVIPVFALGIGGAIAVTAIIAYHFRKAREREMDVRLKAQLVEQGRSADEIERILSAGGDLED